MVGIVLGLGFQWWPNLNQPWQYAAFVFAYLDIVDYWIDYSPSLKKFPPKREIDVMLDVGIMFSLFLYIYATQLTIFYFFTAFIVFRLFDFFWLLSSKREFNPIGTDKVFIDTWMFFNLIEAAGAAVLMGLRYVTSWHDIVIITAFILFRIFMRILASFRYKKVHFV